MSDAQGRQQTILVTGLRRSEAYATDPSGEILSLLSSDPPRGVSCRTLLLPVKPHDALLKAVETMDHFLPDAVLILGVSEGYVSQLEGDASQPAEGDACLVVGRLAMNAAAEAAGGSVLTHSSGFAEPVDAAGPPSYLSTLPVEAMTSRMRTAGVPAKIGEVGTNPMCNRLHYALLHYVALRGHETWFKRSPPSGLVSRVGSVELPPTPEMASASRTRIPSLSLESSLRGVLHAIAAVADYTAVAGDGTAEPRPSLD